MSVDTRRLVALYEMSAASSRELLRDWKSLVGVVFMFVFLLGLIALIHLGINVQRPAPVVAMTVSTPQEVEVESALQGAGIEVRSTAEPELHDEVTATVALRSSEALVTLAYPQPPAWIPIERAIEAAGYQAGEIVVVRQEGTLETDILRINLSTVLIAGFMAIVFLGTSVPIVRMRGRGILRLLGTTPLSRLTFIVAQSPIRVLVGLAEAVVIVVIAWTQGYATAANAGRLAVTLALGLAMLFSLGYLLASRSRNPDLIGQVSGLIPVLIILTSGTMFPVQGIPEVILILMRSVPTTWFIQAASADIAGTTPFTSVYVLWVMMGVVTVACTALAARIFAWDQADAASARK